MNLILGNLSWEFRVYGAVPPNVPKGAEIGTILANVSICTAILPFVSGQNVVIHEVSVEQLKAQIDKQVAAAAKH